MKWKDLDILIDQRLGDDEITDGLACMFEIPRAEVRICSRIEDLSQRTTVECVRQDLVGEFCLHLALFTSSTEVRSVYGMIRQFCRTCGCRGLIDDGSVNPYTWILVDKDREIKVSLNVQKYDEKYEIYLSSDKDSN